MGTRTIQAIETRYAGHRFRSRLEARWAVFFDHLNIPWEYEKEGFGDGENGYLPDFWLTRDEAWFEVKPPNGREEGEHPLWRELVKVRGYPLYIAYGMPRPGDNLVQAANCIDRLYREAAPSKTAVISAVLPALRAIVDGAEGRDLTDSEANQYECLETVLMMARHQEEGVLNGRGYWFYEGVRNVQLRAWRSNLGQYQIPKVSRALEAALSERFGT